MPHFSNHVPGYKRRLHMQCRNSWFHKRGSIDAWVIWDPRTTAANQQIDACILASTIPGLRYGFQPLFSNTKIAWWSEFESQFDDQSATETITRRCSLSSCKLCESMQVRALAADYDRQGFDCGRQGMGLGFVVCLIFETFVAAEHCFCRRQHPGALKCCEARFFNWENPIIAATSFSTLEFPNGN